MIFRKFGVVALSRARVFGVATSVNSYSIETIEVGGFPFGLVESPVLSFFRFGLNAMFETRSLSLLLVLMVGVAAAENGDNPAQQGLDGYGSAVSQVLGTRAILLYSLC